MFPIKDIISSSRPPIITTMIIIVCSFVFFLELTLPQYLLFNFFNNFSLTPYNIVYKHSQYISLLSHMFLHGSFSHILANMWSLWIFGDNVEDAFGHIKFLIFYLLCGLGAVITHIIFNPDSTIPILGASGAISGVMGAYLVLFPHSKIIVLVPIFFWPIFFEVYAFVFMVVWFYIQLYSGLFSSLMPQSANIAWWAHISGFVIGIVLTPLFAKRKKRYASLEKINIEQAWMD